MKLGVDNSCLESEVFINCHIGSFVQFGAKLSPGGDHLLALVAGSIPWVSNISPPPPPPVVVIIVISVYSFSRVEGSGGDCRWRKQGSQIIYLPLRPASLLCSLPGISPTHTPLPALLTEQALDSGAEVRTAGWPPPHSDLCSAWLTHLAHSILGVWAFGGTGDSVGVRLLED